VSILGAGLALLVPLGVFALLLRPFGPVSRVRLERFARRQMLVITPGNGPRVISYLATTRRWRAGGILIATAITAIRTSIDRHGNQLSALAIFAGWFVGAVVAEWRIGSGSRDGVRRSASLMPRRIGDYLSVAMQAVVAVALLAAVAVQTTLVVLARTERLLLTGWLAAAIVVTVGIALVARHVLTRPQPLAEIDVEQADHALRSRSLHVLLGSALALAGYLLSGAANSASHDALWRNAQWPSAMTATGAIVLPMLGIITATSTFAAGPHRYHRAAAL
jgi:hypothetical protein